MRPWGYNIVKCLEPLVCVEESPSFAGIRISRAGSSNPYKSMRTSIGVAASCLLVIPAKPSLPASAEPQHLRPSRTTAQVCKFPAPIKETGGSRGEGRNTPFTLAQAQKGRASSRASSRTPCLLFWLCSPFIFL